MSRQNPAALAVFLLSVLGILGGVALMKGGFYLGKHEGDTIHLVDMLLRMAEGQRPHQDFMTPIGVLSLAPMALFVALGAGVGHAIIYAQILVALVLFPAILRVAYSRFEGNFAYAFGGFVLILILALVHGEAGQSVSISMHYNRWAWALVYIIVPLILLEPRGPARPWLDGGIIGLAMACLALMKVTYFAAFLVPVTVALLARRQLPALVAGLVAGLAVAVVVTVVAGPDLWLAYLRDLIAVAQSPSRPEPGEAFGTVAAAPLYVVATLVALGTVVMLRQGPRPVTGLIVLLLTPAFIYVTYQNFGNDPQWIILLGFLIFALCPAEPLRNAAGQDVRAWMLALGIAAFVQGAPSAINLATSPFRHFSQKEEDMAPMLPGGGRHADLQSLSIRLFRVDGRIAMDGPEFGLARWRDLAEREDVAVVAGEELADCSIEIGLTAWYTSIAEDLVAAGFGGVRLYAADLLNPFWLYGDFPSIIGGAPWNYGGLPGYDNADYLIVPLCPISLTERRNILAEITERGDALTEVRRTPLYVLFQRNRS